MRNLANRRFAVLKKGARSAMAALVDDYLIHMSSGRNSSRTVAWHQWSLHRMLLPFCEEHSITEPSQLTLRLLERLQAEQLAMPNQHTGKPRSPATVRSYMRSVRDFLHWAKRQGEDVADAPAEVRIPRKPKVKLLRDEIRALEDAAGTERNKLIIRVLADTGMRLDELCHLNVDDLVTEDRKRFLQVRDRHYGGGAKGSSARPIPIPRLWGRLKHYIEKTRPKDADSQRIFLSHDRQQSGKHEPLQKRGIEVMLQHLSLDVLGKPVNPHLFRHAFTFWSLTPVARGGGGMSTVQVARILGHKSTAMVDQVYAEMIGSEDSYEALAAALVTEEDNQ